MEKWEKFFVKKKTKQGRQMAAATLALTTTAIDATAAQLSDRKDEQDIKRRRIPSKENLPIQTEDRERIHAKSLR